MKNLLLPLGVAAVLLAACGKKDEPQPNAPSMTPPAGGQPTTTPNQTVPPPATQPSPAQPSDQTTPPPTE